jgi:hypothetical protein
MKTSRSFPASAFRFLVFAFCLLPCDFFLAAQQPQFRAGTDLVAIVVKLDERVIGQATRVIRVLRPGA